MPDPSAYRRASENLIHPDGEAVARDDDASKRGGHENGKEQKAAQLLRLGERPLSHMPPPFCVLRAPSGTHDSMVCFYRTLLFVSTCNAAPSSRRIVRDLHYGAAFDRFWRTRARQWPN